MIESIMQLATLLILPMTVAAVDVYGYYGNNCNSGAGACTNIPQNVCCYNGNNFSSARFIGMQEASFGAVYTPNGSNRCGNLYSQQEDQNVCVNGNQNSLGGAGWYFCESCFAVPGRRSTEARAVDTKCERSVQADKVILADGSVFETGPTTPESARDDLYGLASKGAVISDIPAHLHLYKLESMDR